MKATSPKPASRRSSAAPKSYGVGMAAIRQIAKRVGRDHELALELWKTGWYEARLLTAFVDEADRVTAAQMDAWARDFDNRVIVDTLCFKLWDRTPHAWNGIRELSSKAAKKRLAR